MDFVQWSRRKEHYGRADLSTDGQKRYYNIKVLCFFFVFVFKKSVWINIKCLLNFLPNYILYLLLEHFVAHKKSAVKWCMPCDISLHKNIKDFPVLYGLTHVFEGNP